MFTGIIEDIGIVKQVTGSVLTVVTKLDDIAVKDSVAVSGICLTVTAVQRSSGIFIFSADYSSETCNRTTIGKMKKGGRVNIERALQAQSRLGGHIVTGHIEAVGKVSSAVDSGNSRKIEFTCPAVLKKYVAEKGSVAVDGISLTVASIRGGNAAEFVFGVVAIPYTLDNTTLGFRKTGDYVNIETDMLAKYAVEGNRQQNMSGVTYGLLKRTGFMK